MLRRTSRLAFAILSAALLIVPATATAEEFDDLWLEGQPVLEVAGITKPMFRSLTIWLQGQYHLGYCKAFLAEQDLSHWRNWWDRTIVPQSDVGRALLENGRISFERGERDGASQSPTLQLCHRTLEAWSQAMTAANDAKPQ